MNLSVDQPRSVATEVPVDHPRECMHYAVVRISKYRHIVAEYRGPVPRFGSDSVVMLPTFAAVSGPLRYTQACVEAQRLARRRLAAEPDESR